MDPLSKAKLSVMVTIITSCHLANVIYYTVSLFLGINCKGSPLKVAQKVAGSLIKSVNSDSIRIADGACWCDG